VAARIFPVCSSTSAAMIKPLYILNGPNLNRLGRREPEIYGKATLAEIESECRRAAGEQPLVFLQTNSEQQLIDWIHEASDEGSGIIINPAGYSFTSIAILDALKMFKGPIIELHITNIHRREDHYHHSYISKIASAVIAGLGPGGYVVAVQAMMGMLEEGTLQLNHDWA
jgi:3-dehydroquinate dehydratase-2